MSAAPATAIVKATSWAADKALLMQIRTDVFIREQQISASDEWDAQDEAATHFLVWLNSSVAIGCARLLIENQQHTRVFHIGRVAILEPYRTQGFGSQLMSAILAHCQQTMPQAPVYLHAQTTRRRFYEALGFVVAGNEFIDAGIPHISMWLAVNGSIHHG